MYKIIEKDIKLYCDNCGLQLKNYRDDNKDFKTMKEMEYYRKEFKWIRKNIKTYKTLINNRTRYLYDYKYYCPYCALKLGIIK